MFKFSQKYSPGNWLQFVILSISLCFILECLVSCNKDETKPTQNNEVIIYKPLPVEKTNSINIYVHYMPWFETPETSVNGKWGIHWTMNTCNPEIIDSTYKRQIASWFYPLIGPYASSDRDVIEYHLLLMKYAGVDGLLFDWYGAQQLNDYPSILSNTEEAIDLLDEVGLSFAIVYEDRTIKSAFEINSQVDIISLAQSDMMYIENNYFPSNNYIYVNEKPLLLLFGPEFFHQSSQWSEIFEAFAQKPCFLVLNGKSNETGTIASGEYIWVDQLDLNIKYQNISKFSIFMGGAYPGFKDYYKQGGWGNGLGFTIDYHNGEFFKQALQKASDFKSRYLQLITWNDFGEGTMIEPTLEFGFTFLEILQQFTGVKYSKSELELIYKLYKLRKKYASNTDIQKKLNQAFYFLVSLQVDKAKSILDTYSN